MNQCFAVEFRVNGKKSSRPVAKVSQLPLFAKFILRSNGPYIKNVKWVSSGTIEEFKQLRSKLQQNALQSESIVRRFQESEQVSEQQVAAAHSELHRIVSTHDSLQYSEERLQAIQLSILLPMSQCKVPVVCSKSCIERTMQRLDNALKMIENARQQVGATKQQGAARCIELTEAVEVHLGIVANSKMANVAVIRSKFGFICIGNARICSCL